MKHHKWAFGTVPRESNDKIKYAAECEREHSEFVDDCLNCRCGDYY